MKRIVLLQNAWAKTADQAARMERFLSRMPDDRLYRAFVTLVWNSRTGLVLRKIIGEDFPDDPDVMVIDTTARVSVGSSGLMPYDPAYVKTRIDWFDPQQAGVLLACGKQAARCSEDVWQGRRILMPHPAARFLFANSPVFAEVKRLLDTADTWEGEWKIDQSRDGNVIRQKLLPAWGLVAAE